MAISTLNPETAAPDEDEREAYARIAALLAKDGASLTDSSGERVALPPKLRAVMRRLAAAYAADQVVILTPLSKMLTTQQAADLLNVSRPYLIKLLDEKAILYTMVGTHRRISYDDLMAYRTAWKAEQRRLADELTQMHEEMGFYDLPPRDAVSLAK